MFSSDNINNGDDHHVAIDNHDYSQPHNSSGRQLFCLDDSPFASSKKV